MSRVERVLMTADAVGGVWTYAVELAGALARHHVHVALAVLGPAPSEAQRRSVIALPNVDIHEHGGRLEWMDEPWTDVASAGEWLLALEQQVRPDVVHLNGYCHGALPWQAPVLVAAHSCVRSWWRAVHGGDAPGCWDRYATEVAAGIRAADMVVAPSAAMLTALGEHYGLHPHARVIPNGRTMPPALPVGKEPFVLTAGRLWDQAKNVDAVCAVAPQLPWPVHVAGDAGGSAIACDTVRYRGRLDPSEMQAEMARAGLYVLPARYEPFGLSALEAALAGCPLVLGDIASLREVWGDAALYVDPDDHQALVSTIASLIADEPHRLHMAAVAQRRGQEFTAARMAAGYRAAYADLPHRRGQGQRRPARLPSQAEPHTHTSSVAAVTQPSAVA